MIHSVEQGQPRGGFWLGLLPYVATCVGLWVLDRPLVAVGIYHLGILAVVAVHREVLPKVGKGMEIRILLAFVSLCFLTWPVIVLVWPIAHLAEVSLTEQLQAWGLHGPLVMGFILYSVTLHPVLEEIFWRGIMPDHLFSDMLFSGFHAMVLVLFLSWPWVWVGCVLLAVASFLWRKTVSVTGGLLIPILSHAIADLAIVLAVVQLAHRGR